MKYERELIDLGREIYEINNPGFGAAPPSPEELKRIAREWLRNKGSDIRSALCKNADFIHRTSTAPATEALTTVADVLIVAHGKSQFPILSLARLVCAAGVERFCKGEIEF
jgi:hypothetical protein